MASTSNREGWPPSAVVPKAVPSPPRLTSVPLSSVIWTAPLRTTKTSSLLAADGHEPRAAPGVADGQPPREPFEVAARHRGEGRVLG